MRYIMPNSSPHVAPALAAELEALGAHIKARRKALKVNATLTAESAGMSRVTLHRIEKGGPSVTMGAWANLVMALGMTFALQDRQTPGQPPAPRAGWVPAHIALSDCPQLKALAWQVHGTDTLTPVEAFDIYERNARHLDMQAMPPQEREVWQALQDAYAKDYRHV